MTNNPINALNKWLSLTITSGVGAFTYSWIVNKKLAYLGRYLSFSMKANQAMLKMSFSMKANQAMLKMVASATLSTPSVAASGATTVWANGPAGPPYFLTDY